MHPLFQSILQAHGAPAPREPNQAELDQAKRMGWAAFINGTPRDVCPFPDSDAVLRDTWLRSWDLAKSQPHAVFL